VEEALAKKDQELTSREKGVTAREKKVDQIFGIST